MADQEEIERIRAYVKQHQATHIRQELRQKLLDSGYNPAAVDQVLTELDAMRARQRDDTGVQLSLGQAYLGVLAFGLINLPLMGVVQNFNLSLLGSAILFAGSVIMLSGLSWLLRKPSVGAGLVAGYALMGIVSGGTCTLLTPSRGMQDAGSMIQGLVFYSAALVVLGIALAVYFGTRGQRNS